MAQGERRIPDEIRQDVYTHLSWDDRIDASHIDVDVSDGTVILTGTVPTYPNLIEAERDAYDIPGVRSVDNRLAVLYPTTYPTPADADIAANIENLLQTNPTIDSGEITVSVQNGVVTLSGLVHTDWQRSRAAYIAINVEGVVQLNNQLKVIPKGTVPDKGIKKAIEDSLARNAFVNAEDIDVDVSSGVVTLDGIVDSYRSLQTAERIAKYTAGVVSVINNLSIR